VYNVYVLKEVSKYFYRIFEVIIIDNKIEYFIYSKYSRMYEIRHFLTSGFFIFKKEYKMKTNQTESDQEKILLKEIETTLCYLEKDTNLITEETLITEKMQSIFKKYKMCNVTKLFKKCYSSNAIIFNVILKCQICQQTKLSKLSKTNTINYLKYSEYKCEKCKIIESEKAKQELSEYEKKQAVTIIDNTISYIENYLNPKNSWKNNIKMHSKMSSLKTYNVDYYTIKVYIQDMDYKDFLKTPYWKAISQKMIYESKFKCQLCNSNGILNTHHRTYENHGDELNHTNDLIVLCTNCHNKFHNKVGEK
jgi:hypothetical protein